MADPIESIAVSTTLPSNREFAIKRPGHVAVATRDGMYAGCRYLIFTNHAIPDGLDSADKAAWAAKYPSVSDADGMSFDDMLSDLDSAEIVNEYFRYHANLLVVGWWVDGNSAMHIMVTNQLEGDELEEFQEYQIAVATHMSEWREKKKEEATKLHEADLKEEEEAVELMSMGRKAKEYNLFGKLRELEAEIEALKKELKTAKKGKGK